MPQESKNKQILDTGRILRSLAAVGATLVASSDASAMKINVNQTVGVDSGVPTSPFVLALPGVNGLAVQAIHSVGTAAVEGAVQVRSVNTNTGVRSYAQVRSAVHTGFFDAVSGAQGAVWNSIGGNPKHLGVLGGVLKGSHPVRSVVGTTQVPTGNGGSIATNIYSTKISPFTNLAFATTYANKYFPFRFKDSTHGNQWDYGWIEASLTQQSDPAHVTVNILAYAWDPNGQPLGMGELPSDGISGGGDSTPEPASAGLMALGAMVLGAKGARRWKQSRQAEHTSTF